MGWLNFDNFELGLAALPDLQSRADDWLIDKMGLGDTWVGSLAKLNNTNFSAGVYASQVADGGASYSKAIDDLRAGGYTDGAAALAKAAADKAIAEGALEKAARKTANDLFEGAGDAGKSLLDWLPWVIAGGVVVFGGVAAVRLIPRRSAA